MWSTILLPLKLTEIIGNLSRFQILKINKTDQMFNISVNSEDTNMVDPILESSLEFSSIINYRKSKTIFKSSLDSHVYSPGLIVFVFHFQYCSTLSKVPILAVECQKYPVLTGGGWGR